MEIKPIRTEQDYEAALAAVAPYFDAEPEPGSIEADRFEIMVMLIEAYEAKHYSIDPPDPIAPGTISTQHPIATINWP